MAYIPNLLFHLSFTLSLATGYYLTISILMNDTHNYLFQDAGYISTKSKYN